MKFNYEKPPQKMVKCPHCSGTGKKDGKKCQSCNGTGETEDKD